MIISLYTISISLMILLPVVAAVMWRRRFAPRWWLFCVGMLTFVGSQIYHFPLNKWLSNLGVIGEIKPDAPDLLGTAVVLGFSAGLSETIAKRLKAVHGTVDATTNYRPNNPELIIEPKPEVVGLFDLTEMQIARAIQTAVAGDTTIQITLDDDAFGDGQKYLKPNTQLQVSMYEDKPLVVTLPNTVDLEVKDTPPEIKGATATNQNKPATLETGLVVQVPPFIKTGELIRVDTRTGEYVTRVK